MSFSGLPLARLPAGYSPALDSLKDRVVLVTGATGGLGRATAFAAARAGASVILLGRKVSALEAIYDEIETIGTGKPAIYPLNLEGATPHDYGELAATIERECGRLDGIAHCAAHLPGLMPAEQIKAEEWMRGLQVNLNAPFLLTQACHPLLRKSPDASVVFVLDDPSRMRKAFWGAYGVAKHGLEGLISILHEQWETSPIRIHALLPAPMRTALRRMAYFGEDSLALPTADRSVEALVYLLSAQAASVRGNLLDLRCETQ